MNPLAVSLCSGIGCVVYHDPLVVGDPEHFLTISISCCGVFRTFEEGVNTQLFLNIFYWYHRAFRTLMRKAQALNLAMVHWHVVRPFRPPRRILPTLSRQHRLLLMWLLCSLIKASLVTSVRCKLLVCFLIRPSVLQG